MYELSDRMAILFIKKDYLCGRFKIQGIKIKYNDYSFERFSSVW